MRNKVLSRWLRWSLSLSRWGSALGNLGASHRRGGEERKGGGGGVHSHHWPAFPPLLSLSLSLSPPPVLLREEVSQLQEEIHLLRQMKDMLTKDLEETHGGKAAEILPATELRVQLAQKEQELARAREALQGKSTTGWRGWGPNPNRAIPRCGFSLNPERQLKSATQTTYFPFWGGSWGDGFHQK